ncbi:hypothetical protein [Sporisorium scitamineum]|uniref:60S ribosomal protein L27 n=1 Tax=Sporisorium scitamineum TaxID=49012 RepID=A0A0F7S1R7_9BASI|nr:hypothetical protein [Sporisorium scitamineum]
MPKIYKPGKVAVVLSGRHAGKKSSWAPIDKIMNDQQRKACSDVSFDMLGSARQPRLGHHNSIADDHPSVSLQHKLDSLPHTASFPVVVVIIKQFDDGSKDKSFPYIVAAGIERYPQKVTKRMGAKKIAKRSKVKPFVKIISYNHLMPTRYALELEGLKGAVTQDTFKEPSQREDAKKQIKQIFEEKYTSGKNKWFFTPLRF